MYYYLVEDILAEAPDDFDGEDATPAVSNLFQVDEVCRKLHTQTADLFHHFVARFFICGKESKTGFTSGSCISMQKS